MTEPRRWHFGYRYVAVDRRGKRKVWWVSHWLAHPCRDLAVPFELGGRVMTAEWVALVAVLVPQFSPPGPPLPPPACAVPVPYHCDPRPR